MIDKVKAKLESAFFVVMMIVWVLLSGLFSISCATLVILLATAIVGLLTITIPLGMDLGLSFGSAAKQKRKNTMAENNHQQGPKNSQFGSMWITNGVINKKIPKDALIPEGYNRGRKLNK